MHSSQPASDTAGRRVVSVLWSLCSFTQAITAYVQVEIWTDQACWGGFMRTRQFILRGNSKTGEGWFISRSWRKMNESLKKDPAIRRSPKCDGFNCPQIITTEFTVAL